MSEESVIELQSEVAFTSNEEAKNQDVYVLVADVLSKVREELDDHREAINENTNEITLNHEFLNELSGRMDKLSERLDELTLLVKCGQQTKDQEWKITPLTSREKEVFHSLYVLGEDRNNAVTYKELSKQLKTSESSVAAFVASFVAKGIPVVKKYSGGRAYVGLDPAFKLAQAKSNIVGINTLLTYWQNP
jgi:chromosome segregation ATPase